MAILAAAPLWWGVDWSSALLAMATGVLAIGIVITIAGVFSARGSVVAANKARSTEIYADISRRWDSDDLIDARARIDRMDPEAFMDWYRSVRDSDNPSERRWCFEVKRLANFFEDLGILESRGCLDIQWIEASLGSVVNEYWDVWELAAVDERKTERGRLADASLIWGHWESLAKELNSRRVRIEGHHPKTRWHRRKHY